MKRRTLLIVITVFGVSLLTITALLTLAISLFVRYVREEALPREIPTAKIKRVFKAFTTCELPLKADGLRAIRDGGRDPIFFVKFRTDSEGVEYIKRIFDEKGANSKYIDKNMLKYRPEFAGVSHMQEYTGVRLFDKKSIGPGIEISTYTRHGSRYYYHHIFIEDQSNTVYISASLR